MSKDRWSDPFPGLPHGGMARQLEPALSPHGERSRATKGKPREIREIDQRLNEACRRMEIYRRRMVAFVRGERLRPGEASAGLGLDWEACPEPGRRDGGAMDERRIEELFAELGRFERLLLAAESGPLPIPHATLVKFSFAHLSKEPDDHRHVTGQPDEDDRHVTPPSSRDAADDRHVTRIAELEAENAELRRQLTEQQVGAADRARAYRERKKEVGGRAEQVAEAWPELPAEGEKQEEKPE